MRTLGPREAQWCMGCSRRDVIPRNCVISDGSYSWVELSYKVHETAPRPWVNVLHYKNDPNRTQSCFPDFTAVKRSSTCSCLHSSGSICLGVSDCLEICCPSLLWVFFLFSPVRPLSSCHNPHFLPACQTAALSEGQVFLIILILTDETLAEKLASARSTVWLLLTGHMERFG